MPSSPSQHWLDFKDAVLGLEQLVERTVSMELDTRLEHLTMALNRFELTILALELREPTDDRENGPDNSEARAKQVATAFPELGCYHSIWMGPANEPEEADIGDAANDLAEILNDIDYALWAEGRTSWVDGVFEARFMYQAHTGYHIATLRAHLFTLRFSEPWNPK